MKSNDGYITDSLGWALYKLKRYDKAKFTYKSCSTNTFRSKIVNDHFADILWMNGKNKQGLLGICFEFKRRQDELKNKISLKYLMAQVLKSVKIKSYSKINLSLKF